VAACELVEDRTHLSPAQAKAEPALCSGALLNGCGDGCGEVGRPPPRENYASGLQGGVV
jgi:hypothetical protein